MFIAPDVQRTFRQSSNGYISRSDAESSPAPPYVIATAARNLPPDSPLPTGYDADTLDRIRSLTGWVDRDVAISPRQADELAEIGTLILTLHSEGNLPCDLNAFQQMSIRHLLNVVRASRSRGRP